MAKREFVLKYKDTKEYFYKKVELDFHGGDTVNKRTGDILTVIINSEQGSKWIFSDKVSAQIACDEVNAFGVDVEVIEVFKQSILKYDEVEQLTEAN
ncbi:MAG: hypothetical protein ACRC6U_04070 [Fusobacteriaceae bacterium]